MSTLNVAVVFGPALSARPGPETAVVRETSRGVGVAVARFFARSRSIFRLSPVFAVFLALVFARQHAAADTSVAGAHPILVELFTSEGCSSCPPADALLEKLDSSQPIAGAQLIVLSEHVDYWDHDGWKDPASSPAMTERQSDYVSALGLQTPYTPQMIVDGTSEIRVGDPNQIIKTFEAHAVLPKDPLRIEEAGFDASTPGILKARIGADGSANKRDADIYVAVALDHTESQVLHGENGGRRLTHVAVVQQLTKIGRVQKGKTFDQTVRINLKLGLDPKNMRVIVFLQEPGPGRILGAALWKPAV